MIVDAALDEQPRPGDAGLAGRREDARERADDRLVQVGVLEDDVRRLAAQFHRHRDQQLAGVGGDLSSHAGAAGEAETIDATAGQQCLPRAVVAGDDVDDAWRKARFLDELRELESRHGRMLRRLDDDAVARGQGRGQLVREQSHRRIPCRDQHGDADRLAACEVEHVAHVERNGVAEDLIGTACEEAIGACREVHLSMRLSDHLAVVGGLENAHPVGVSLQDVGKPHQQPTAFLT